MTGFGGNIPMSEKNNCMNKEVEIKRDRKNYRKRPQGNSTVSKDILDFWNKNSKWGAASRIHEATGLSRPTIKSALNGSATDEVIAIITDYYLNLNKDGKEKTEGEQAEG